LGDQAQWIHYGLTSSDVVDTALSLTMKQSADLIIKAIGDLLVSLEHRIREHQDTIMVGRSHGMHAEPTTFGLVLASHYEEIARGMYRVMDAKEAISVGAISGTVGNYTNVDPMVESLVCDQLGLTPDRISTQVICRDRHAQYFSALSIVATSIERMAVQFRHLQRSEVDEVEEGFASKQRGSSAMPHKKNPITSENLTGLARLVRSYAGSAIENMVLWHERDISHSSVERVIGPDANSLVHHMAKKAKQLIDNLVVKPDNMLRNLERSKTSITSHRMLLELVNCGMKRSEAHSLVRRSISENNFEDICGLLGTDLDDLQEFRWFTRHSKMMVERLFSASSTSQHTPDCPSCS
jgi:adenylosuccinate lyase